MTPPADDRHDRVVAENQPHGPVGPADRSGGGPTMHVIFGSVERWPRNPRAMAYRGVVAVLFGLLTLVWPGLTLTALVILWGAFALVDGIGMLIALVTRSPGTEHHRLLLALQGVAGVGAGVVTFVWPSITALALLLVIAAWALFMGAAEISAAVRYRTALRHHWLVALSGLLSLAVGVALIAAPVAGALAITWLIGWWALVFGGLALSEAWHLRARGPRHHAPPTGPAVRVA